MKISILGGIAAATLCSAALLVGCGSSDSAGSSTAAATSDTTATVQTTADTTGQKVGGPSTCDQATISKAVEDTKTSEGAVTLATADSFGCADGWAYAFVNVGTGSSQYTATQVFEAEGQFWIPKDRQKVCIAPGNQVPKAIYQEACNSN